MQVWIAGHHGVLREVIGLFVDGSNKAESYSCFGQQIAIFRVEATLRTKCSCDLDRNVLSSRGFYR